MDRIILLRCPSGIFLIGWSNVSFMAPVATLIPAIASAAIGLRMIHIGTSVSGGFSLWYENPNQSSTL